MLEHLVIVTGVPASGKSLVAEPLARELDFPLISKDVLKEALDDALPCQSRNREWSSILGAISYDVIWNVAPAYRQLVLDSPLSLRHREQVARLCPAPVEVFCDCPSDEAVRRFAARASSRHRVHVDYEVSHERLAIYGQPMRLGPVLSIDTTRPIDLENVVDWVRAQLR